MTCEGIILGTAAYMAPEQARGQSADKRTDLWAFGCVLYEMLTGRRAFAGQDPGETLAAVIKDEPDWGALPNETPPSIRRLLRRCLMKDPKGRLSDAAVARIEIDEALGEPQIDTYATQTTSRRKERFAWASALLLVGAVAIVAVMSTRRPEPPAGEVRFEIQTPPTTDPISLAISPDGQKIVFVATSEGRNKLWLRRLDSASAEPLAGTDGALAPFWSPDSRSVAFFTSRQPAQTLGYRRSIDAGAWNVSARHWRNVEPGRHDSLFSLCRAIANPAESPPMVARLLRPPACSRRSSASYRSSFLMVVISCFTRPVPRRPRSSWATSMDPNRGACSRRIPPRRMSPRGTWCSAGEERSLRKPSTRTVWP